MPIEDTIVVQSVMHYLLYRNRFVFPKKSHDKQSLALESSHLRKKIIINNYIKWF